MATTGQTERVSPTDQGARRPGRWIDGWHPDDDDFWRSRGRPVAIRNLIVSVLVENLGFSVWLVWSAVVPMLARAGYHFSLQQLFWLVATPSLVGSFARFPYTFAVARFGGRNWTVVSALLLLVPTGLLATVLLQPAPSYPVFLFAAATAGLGGGNFASSMANISFFFPERRKGLALGVNAAGGNLGVSVVQFVIPLVVGVGLLGDRSGTHLHVQNAGLVWIPAIVVSAVLAWSLMDNLSVARSPLREQLRPIRRGYAWLVSLLYLGTFGSFIGYSAALPLVLKTEFPHAGLLQVAFIGALVGALARPIGGWLADRVGGSQVTLVAFVAMFLGVGGVWISLRDADLGGVLAGFLLLFVASGIGNGSTFRMIPAIARAESMSRLQSSHLTAAERLVTAERDGSVVLGFTSAIGALGGFVIPLMLGASVAATHAMGDALLAFGAYYLVCLAVTWRSSLVGDRVAGHPRLTWRFSSR